MINYKNFKNLLKPLVLSKIIILVVSLTLTAYYFIYSNVDNYYSMRYIGVIQQFSLPIIFLINGIEEIKKTDRKKSNIYGSFIAAIIMMTLAIATYINHCKVISN